MVSCQDCIGEQPCRKPHSWSQHHRPTQKGMSKAQSKYLALRVPGYQIGNQLLTLRGEGNHGNHKGVREVGHILGGGGKLGSS